MTRKRIAKVGISRVLISLTLMLVLALYVGSVFYPNTFVMSLAETTTAYALIRGGIIVLLIGLLMTYAPRTIVFRLALGAWALALAVTALQLVLTYQMNLLDAVVFTELAIIFAIEALETRSIPIKKPYIPARRIPVTTV